MNTGKPVAEVKASSFKELGAKMGFKPSVEKEKKSPTTKQTSERVNRFESKKGNGRRPHKKNAMVNQDYSIPNAFGKEGEDHINVSLLSTTALGRLLDPAYFLKFNYAGTTTFMSVLNLFLWLADKHKNDAIRTMKKKDFHLLPVATRNSKIANYQPIMARATMIKLALRPSLIEEIKKLPDNFAILSYTQNDKLGIRETNSFAPKLIPVVKEIIAAIKEGRDVNYGKFGNVVGTLENGFLEPFFPNMNAEKPKVAQPKKKKSNQPRVKAQVPVSVKREGGALIVETDEVETNPVEGRIFDAFTKALDVQTNTFYCSVLDKHYDIEQTGKLLEDVIKNYTPETYPFPDNVVPVELDSSDFIKYITETLRSHFEDEKVLLTVVNAAYCALNKPVLRGEGIKHLTMDDMSGFVETVLCEVRGIQPTVAEIQEAFQQVVFTEYTPESEEIMTIAPEDAYAESTLVRYIRNAVVGSNCYSPEQIETAVHLIMDKLTDDIGYLEDEIRGLRYNRMFVLTVMKEVLDKFGDPELVFGDDDVVAVDFPDTNLSKYVMGRTNEFYKDSRSAFIVAGYIISDVINSKAGESFNDGFMGNTPPAYIVNRPKSISDVLEQYKPGEVENDSEVVGNYKVPNIPFTRHVLALLENAGFNKDEQITLLKEVMDAEAETCRLANDVAKGLVDPEALMTDNAQQVAIDVTKPTEPPKGLVIGEDNQLRQIEIPMNERVLQEVVTELVTGDKATKKWIETNMMPEVKEEGIRDVAQHSVVEED